MHATDALKTMSKEQLLATLPKLASSERAQLVVLLDYLGELGERCAYEEAGYSSLWDYARRALLYSEMQASLRTKAARAMRRKPELRAMLADGRLSLCTLCTLEPCLGEVDADELIALAAYKTKRQVEDLVNERIGKPAPKRDSIRRMGPVADATAVSPRLRLGGSLGLRLGESPGLRLGGSPGLRLGEPSGVEGSVAAAPAQAEFMQLASPPAEPQPPAARVDAVAPAMSHRISFSTRAAVAAKLRRLEELLGATSLDEVIEKAADALLDRVDPERRAARRKKSKAAKPAKDIPPAAATLKPARSRRPPKALADEVKLRGGQQCTYVSSSDVRCAERRHLQIDHCPPFALGGSSTNPEHLRGLCRTHNLMLARQTFPELVPPRRSHASGDAAAPKLSPGKRMGQRATVPPTSWENSRPGHQQSE